MDRYVEAAKSLSAPTPPAANSGYPTNGNPVGPIPASEPGEWWFHMITEELRAVIVAAGLTPDHADLTQLLQALELLYSPMGYAQLGVAQTFTKAQRGAVVNLSSAAGSIALDLALANNYKHVLTENTVLAAPSNVVEGQSGFILLQQHASAAKTLAYNTFWKFPGGTVPSLTTTLSAIDVLIYSIEPGATRATCQLLKDVK